MCYCTDPQHGLHILNMLNVIYILRFIVMQKTLFSTHLSPSRILQKRILPGCKNIILLYIYT